MLIWLRLRGKSERLLVEPLRLVGLTPHHVDGAQLLVVRGQLLLEAQRLVEGDGFLEQGFGLIEVVAVRLGQAR